MRRGIMHSSLLMVASLFVSSVAFAAQDTDETNDAFGVSTNFFLEKVEQAKRNSANISFGYTSIVAEFEWQFLVFEIEHRMYDWETTTNPGSSPVSDPWENLTRIAPGIQYYRELSGKWSVWAKFMAYSGFEDEISSDSWTYSPQVVGFYQLGPPITLYGGLGVRYHSVDAVVYPIVGVSWGHGSKRGFSGNVGFPDTEVRYGFTDKVVAQFTFEWDIRIYRLAGNGDLISGGYLRAEDIIPGLRLTYEPIDGLSVYAGVRGYFGRQLTVYDRGEHEMDESDVEDSWSYILGMDYRF